MNNVVILGYSTVGDFIGKITRYTDPENLKIYAPHDAYCIELGQALEKLNIPCYITHTEEEFLAIKVNLVIVFTTFIGIKEVSMLTDAHQDGIDVIFCKPEIKLYGQITK